MKRPWRKKSHTTDFAYDDNDYPEAGYVGVGQPTRMMPQQSAQDNGQDYSQSDFRPSHARSDYARPGHVQPGYGQYPDDAYATYQDAYQEELLLGRYIVSGEAGAGAFASVVVAWDTRIQRRVAIKCMPLEQVADAIPAQGGSILVGENLFDTSSITGLEEARTAAMLSDPSIVQVYDFEVQDGMAYLILEYVDGMTLADLLACYPDEINADIVASIFKAVSHALEVAHKRHVLHLDIKPENVLIDKQGRAKVTDFGLARLATEAGYGTAVGGTIGYMPPEQMTGRELDERCDQWALASLTYEMISGENPFVVDSLRDAEDAIYDAEIVIPSLCMEGLDEDIDDILFCALDPDPAERYDSVKDFATQLQPCLGSTRKGKNALKRLVGHMDSDSDDGEFDDEETGAFAAQEYEDERSSEPWHMTPRMRSVGMRAWSVIGSGMVSALALTSFFGETAWAQQPIAWGALVALLALAAVLPHVGALLSGVVFGVALCTSNAPIPGVVLMAATGAWWYFSGRFSVESTNVGLSSVVFGSIGMAPLVPFVAGFLLPARDALISTLYAAGMAILLAGLGSGSLLGWDMVAHILAPVGPNYTDVVIMVVSQPSTWIMVLGWVIGAVAASLLCGTGKKVWCVVGMLLAGACLIACLVFGSLADTAGKLFLQNPVSLAHIIGSAVLGVVLASTVTPGRAYLRSSDFD